MLRNRSRALVRDAAYAKRARVIVQNNVIGFAGIGLQAQVMSTRGELRDDINDAIEEAFREWGCAENCHTGGTLHFADLERALLGQEFDAGEVLIRKHYSRFGESKIPLALELIEAERVADEIAVPFPVAGVAGTIVKMGVEQNRFGRPIAYYIRSRHPGEARFVQGETDKVERVPAEQIIHLRIVERWPQTRGEPWLHATARKLNDMDGYSEAEIVAARANACVGGAIESPDPQGPLGNDPNTPSARPVLELEAGMFPRLAPGEKLTSYLPNRPNSALDPFMRYMLREVAAGTGYGISYESLSRDYSQSNYSSSRLALLDDRDSWRALQQWYIRNFRMPLHREWLKMAVLSRAIPQIPVDQYAADPRKFEAALFKPRGWGWIDPTKEVEAYEKAVDAGFTTRADVIAATGDGRDIEDVDRQRSREIEKEKQLSLEFTTSPSVYAKKGQAAAPKPAAPKDGGGEDPPPDGEGEDSKAIGPQLRAVSFPAR